MLARVRAKGHARRNALLDEAERAESTDPAPPTVPASQAQAGGTVRALPPARPALRVIDGGAR